MLYSGTAHKEQWGGVMDVFSHASSSGNTMLPQLVWNLFLQKQHESVFTKTETKQTKNTLQLIRLKMWIFHLYIKYNLTQIEKNYHILLF